MQACKKVPKKKESKQVTHASKSTGE